jgi:hypothetical protein
MFRISLFRIFAAAFCAGLSLPASAQPALPLTVQADMILREITAAITSNDAPGALSAIARYRSLGVAVPPRIAYFEARLAALTGDDERANRALAEYFQKVNSADPEYNAALDLYSGIDRRVKARAATKAANDATRAAAADAKRQATASAITIRRADTEAKWPTTAKLLLARAKALSSYALKDQQILSLEAMVGDPAVTASALSTLDFRSRISVLAKVADRLNPSSAAQWLQKSEAELLAEAAPYSDDYFIGLAKGYTLVGNRSAAQRVVDLALAKARREHGYERLRDTANVLSKLKQMGLSELRAPILTEIKAEASRATGRSTSASMARSEAVGAALQGGDSLGALALSSSSYDIFMVPSCEVQAALEADGYSAEAEKIMSGNLCPQTEMTRAIRMAEQGQPTDIDISGFTNLAYPLPALAGRLVIAQAKAGDIQGYRRTAVVLVKQASIHPMDNLYEASERFNGLCQVAMAQFIAGDIEESIATIKDVVLRISASSSEPTFKASRTSCVVRVAASMNDATLVETIMSVLTNDNWKATRLAMAGMYLVRPQEGEFIREY